MRTSERRVSPPFQTSHSDGFSSYRNALQASAWFDASIFQSRAYFLQRSSTCRLESGLNLRWKFQNESPASELPSIAALRAESPASWQICQTESFGIGVQLICYETPPDRQQPAKAA